MSELHEQVCEATGLDPAASAPTIVMTDAMLALKESGLLKKRRGKWTRYSTEGFQLLFDFDTQKWTAGFADESYDHDSCVGGWKTDIIGTDSDTPEEAICKFIVQEMSKDA